MELQEATEKLKPFVSTNEYPNHIKAVAFADGYGYSTDGRIAVRTGIVNFGYIYSIVKALGAELLWGCKKNGNASSYIVFKSLDGKTIQDILCQEFARNDNIGTILFKKVERGEGNGSVNL